MDLVIYIFFISRSRSNLDDFIFNKGCFRILCCFSIIFTLTTWVDFRCRYSLCAGGLRSLLSALHLRGLPQHACPAGVSYLPLHSTSTRIYFANNNNLYEKSLNKRSIRKNYLSLETYYFLLHNFYIV